VGNSVNGKIELKVLRRVCYPGNTAVSQPHRALIYCYLSQWEKSVNGKTESKTDSLLLMGLNPETFGMPTHRSDHTAKFHPLQ
jgi:hypothetical protein